MVLPSYAACSVSGIRGTDPGRAAIGAEIDRAAARRHVPPYVLKAIAWQESSWKQFDAYHRVRVSSACAIGVLQVLARGFDARRLATDYRYNIDAGARMLRAKMDASSANVPRSLGPDDARVGENWYRATYRYNGSGYIAMRYADAVYSTIVAPPSAIRPYDPPVAVMNPRNVVRGYTPQSGHGYVAHLDGSWTSTLGTYHHTVVRADWIAAAARMSAGRALEGDQAYSAVFVARNVGWQPWPTSRVSLSTYPVGRASRLRHGSWLTATRTRYVAAATPPGAEGRFGFWVRAANLSSALTVSETFTPVVDGTISLGARAASSWTLNPARAPVASIVSAPAYVTDQSTGSGVAVGVRFADPSPGAGVAYVEVARSAPGDTAWSAPARVTTSPVRLTLTGAGTHRVRIRAVDRAGHASAWTDPAAIVVPRDNADTSLTFSGSWTAPDDADAWLGSLASAPAGSSVSLPVNGTSYAVIGPRGPGLGKLTVYLDDVLVTVIDPAADTYAQRQVLWHDVLAPGDHVLRLVAGDETTATPAALSEQPASPSPVASFDAIAVG